MAAPTTNPYPPAPLLTDSGEVFDAKAFEFAASLEPRRQELQAQAEWIDTRANAVEQEIQDAIQPAANAAAQQVTQDTESAFNLSQAQREAEFNADQTSREQQFSTFIASGGYQFLGDYEAGIEITQYNQLVRDSDGEFWRLSGSTTLPYTTTGAGLPEGDSFTPVGDAAVRSEASTGTLNTVNRTLKQVVEQAYSLGAVTVAASNSSNDVKEYATYVCDGVDDHVQINTALANHSRVVLTDGTYFLGGTVQPQSNTALIGQGKDRTKLELGLGLSASGIAAVRSVGNSNVILKGFTIDGNGDQQGFTGNPEGLLLSTGQNFYISDVRVFNINHHAVEISFGFENAVFEDCEFDYCTGDTLEIELAENVYFYRCKFSRAGAFPHPTFSALGASHMEFEQRNKNIRFIDCEFDGTDAVSIVFSVEGSTEPLMEDIYFTRCDFKNIRGLCNTICPTNGVYFSDCRIKGNNAEGSYLIRHQRDAHDIFFYNCRISDFRLTTTNTEGDLHVNLYDTDLINVGQVRASNQADVKWNMRGGSISYNPDSDFSLGFFLLSPTGSSDFDNTVTEITLNDVGVSDLTHPLLSSGVKYKFIARNLRFKNVLMTGSSEASAVLHFNQSFGDFASDVDIYADVNGFTIEGYAELGVTFGIRLKQNHSLGSVQIRLDNWDFQNTLTPFRDGDISDMGSSLTLGRGLGFDLSPQNAGVTTITSGTTEVVLYHTDTFPYQVQDADIQVTPNGSLGAATRFWAYRHGSLSWRIAVDQDPGQDVQFSWRLMRIPPYQP